MTAWTDEKREQIRAMRAAKIPFSVIAKVLGASRNACIGMARRMGMSKPKPVNPVPPPSVTRPEPLPDPEPAMTQPELETPPISAF